MPIAWFICLYKLSEQRVLGKPVRYCAMDDFTQDIIYKDKGNWAESEILGNKAVVKVSASEETIKKVSETKDFEQLDITDIKATLTVEQQTDITSKAVGIGYTTADISAKSLVTQKDALELLTSYRRKPRYDADTDTVILDGVVQVCRSIDDVDSAVRE